MNFKLIVLLVVSIWVDCAYTLSQENGLYEIDSEVIHEDLSFLSPYLEGKNIVLTGENHRFYGSNELIKLKFIFHLYKKGYRNFLLELGSGVGYLFDEYVVHDNKAAFAIIENFFGEENTPYERFLNEIKSFNKERPLEEKIRIHGVDYTRFPFFTLKALALIIEQQGCERELNEYYEDLNVVSSGTTNIDETGFFTRKTPENFNLRAGFKTYRNRIFELSIRNLIQDFERDTLRFQLALGPKYKAFDQLIADVKETLNWYKGEGIKIQSHIQRERYMAKNIAHIIREDSAAKVFGQFGRCHIRDTEFSQDCYGFDLPSISQRLEKMDTNLFAVKSIPILYLEDRYMESNKSVTGLRTSKLLPIAKLYFYNNNSNALEFTKDNIVLDDIAIVNTFSSEASLEDVLDAQKVNYPSRLAYYNGTDSEDITSFFAGYADVNQAINTNFGVDFLNRNHFSYGLDFRNVSNDGGQSLIRFSMVHPMHYNSDSVDLRYTNYRFQFGGGYNFIHNKAFSLYSDLSLFFGFAKIRERKPPLQQVHTFDVKSEQVNYRNPYIGGAISLGARFKMGAFSIFTESTYQRDFSNKTWRVRGAEVPEIDRLSFTNFLFFAGISFAY